MGKITEHYAELILFDMTGTNSGSGAKIALK